MTFRSGLQITREKSAREKKSMPSLMASSVAYSRVSSSTYLFCPLMVATGSRSPKASTTWLVLVALAV